MPWTALAYMSTMMYFVNASVAFPVAGPATAAATEAYSKYIIVDMYAKAVQGTKAEDAVKWAEGELKKIYEG